MLHEKVEMTLHSKHTEQATYAQDYGKNYLHPETETQFCLYPHLLTPARTRSDRGTLPPVLRVLTCAVQVTQQVVDLLLHLQNTLLAAYATSANACFAQPDAGIRVLLDRSKHDHRTESLAKM
jgi:hypothetical protein